MAHFAKVDSNNIVLGVTKVDNSILHHPDTGEEVEQRGIDHLENTFGQVSGITWIQCSRWDYEGERRLKARIDGPVLSSTGSADSFRHNYPLVGAEWKPDINKFINLSPYPSWTLNEDHNWRAPVTSPTEEQCWYGEGDFVSVVEEKNYPVNDPLITRVDVVHPETGETLSMAEGRMPAVWYEDLQQWRGLHTDGAMRVWNGSSWEPSIS